MDFFRLFVKFFRTLDQDFYNVIAYSFMPSYPTFFGIYSGSQKYWPLNNLKGSLAVVLSPKYVGSKNLGSFTMYCIIIFLLFLSFDKIDTKKFY